MTLAAHKVLDTLRGKTNADLLYLGKKNARYHEYVAHLIEKITAAEKFDFGELAFEPSSVDKEAFVIPELTKEELEFFYDGLIPLPAPLCWFEFTLAEQKACLLVEETRYEGVPCWTTMRVDYSKRAISLLGTYVHAFYGCPASALNGKIRVMAIEDEIIRIYKEEIPKLAPEKQACDINIVIYLNLMLNSRTSEIQKETPPTKLNAARQKKELTPLFEHRVVTIIPTKFKQHAVKEGEHDRRPPRLHWRRSHIRVLSSGKRIVIPRFLVGRRDLGEISHDYVIKRQ